MRGTKREWDPKMDNPKADGLTPLTLRQHPKEECSPRHLPAGNSGGGMARLKAGWMDRPRARKTGKGRARPGLRTSHVLFPNPPTPPAHTPEECWGLN